MKRCLGCMEEYDDSFFVCPHCGYVEGAEPDEAIHMLPGTVLNNRFIVGKVVGFGGFGVTYIAWDIVLQHRVAIKEYLPSEFSTRIPGQTQITIFDGEKHEQYMSGMERFVEEAKKLAKFNDAPGIVRIYDSFTENETAYIVMEYLEGETLDKILKREKTIQPEQAVRMIMPIMESLKRVHKEGVIHRDIAPDNVMVTVDGEMKLIDFGAARYATTSHSRSLTVIIKPGYSPEEQYRSRGDQGPHTDVYAICAMLYRMITGITPPDAFERRAFFESKKKDILEPIKKYCKDIPENIHNAIMNGMNVRIEDRSKDMAVLMNELTSEEPVKRIYGKIKKIDVLRWPLWTKIAVPLAACSVIVLGVLFALGIIGFKSDLQNDIIIPDGMTRVPAIINTYLTQSEEALQKANLMYTFEDKTESEVIPKDYVLWQSVNPGQIAQVNSEIRIIVSAGPTLAKVESVEGLSKEEAVKLLEEAGFVVTCMEEYDSTTAQGAVISQSIEGEQYVSKGSSVQLLISKGKAAEDNSEEKIILAPSFEGLTYEEARRLAAEQGVTISVLERKYSSEYEANVVMAQNIEQGTEMSNSDVVQLTISLGIRQVRVPDVTLETEEEVKKLFEQNELTYVIKEAYDDNVKEGLVISQSIAEGEMVAPGTPVEIVISKGRESFEMPSVIEMKEAEAKALLTSEGLAVTVTYANSETVASGNVITQSIDKGTKVIAGTAVSIVVSSGENLYEVPDVLGKDEKSAVEALEDLLFKVQVTKVYDEDVAEGKVVAQSLNAGSQHKKRADIIISISKGKQPLKITYDATGGECDNTSKIVYLNGVYGDLPIPTREYFTFDGWYTAKSGGTKVTATSIVKDKSDQTLYAQWKRNTVSIIYDNGDGKVHHQVGAFQGDNYEHPKAPTKTYYTFMGWYTDKTGGKRINEGNLITATGSQRLYAQWKRNTLTVSFNANGGKTNSSNTLNQGDKYTLPDNPTRMGYVFNGWFTSASGGVQVTSATKVDKTGSQTLYAQWTPINYTIKYDGNGSTSGSTGNSNHTYDVANVLTSNGYIRTGYTFQGWSTSKTAATASYTNAQSVKNLSSVNSGTVTLYAVWKANTYTITYDGNGALGGSTAISNHTYDALKSLTSNGYTKTGYTFQGWSTSEASSEVTYTNGQNVKNISNVNGGKITLYAVWKANTYSVAYNGNGATGGSTETSNHTYEVSKDLTSNGYTKTGYTFQGWSTSSSSTTVAYTDGQNIKNLSSTSGEKITLYAVWKANTYTVSYNGNGATGGSTGNSSHTYDVENALTNNGYTRTGYIFQGWSTSNTASSATYTNGQRVKNLSNGGTITLYAVWKSNTYTVAYNGNGATGGSTGNSNHTYGAWKNLTSNGYTRTGYTFQGWSTNSTATSATYSNGQSVQNLTSSNGGTVTLYAVWKVNTYKIVYNGNGATSGSMGASSYAYGETKALTSNQYTKDYYTFTGWNTASNGTGESYANGVNVKNLTSTNGGTITLYAQWKQKPEESWTPKSSIPNGAKITGTKYTYILTTTNTTGVTPIGYSLVSKVKSGETLIKTVEGNYIKDTYGLNLNDGNISKYNITPPAAYSNSTGRATCTSVHSGYYLYWHWCRNQNVGPTDRFMSNVWTSTYHTFHWHIYDNNLSTIVYQGETNWLRNDYNICFDSYWWCRKDIYKYTYNEYTYVYTYTYNKSTESTTYPTGNNVSNIKEYVKYIPK